MTPATARRLAVAAAKAADWTAQRNALIAEAVAEGGSLREVAAACGLSHTAVGFIANGRPA